MKNKDPIIIRVAGGLGNQLYQYAFGRSLSLRSGRRLLLETRNIMRDSFRKYELHLLNIKEKFPDQFTSWCVRWATSESSGKWFQALFPPARNYRIIRDKEKGYDASVFNLKDGTLVFEGYWQSFRYFEPDQDIIKSELTFKTEPSRQNARMLDEIGKVQSVAVHVRRGDYVTNHKCKDLHGTLSLSYYQKADNHIRRNVTEPHFYIFTDDPEWANKSLTFSGPTYVVEHNLGKADHEDFRLMTHCKHFVIANSSFSWWGAWLANFSDKIIIAPKKWYQTDNFPHEDRIPSGWIRI